MKHIIATTIVAVSAIAGVVGAAEPPATHLLAEARRAGVEASPLVFDRESEAGAEADTDRRVSGKAVVLAAAIASAALVTTAWLISRNSGNGCRPDPRFSRRLDYWTTIVSGQRVTLDDGTRVTVPGPEPHPPLGPPGATFPDLCVAR